MSAAPAATPLTLLLQRQRSTQLRDRLHQLRDQYKLKDDDAIWGVIAVLETYCDELQLRATALNSPHASSAPPSILHWLSLSAGATVQVVLLALAYSVGQHATTASRPVWWSVPAGWMAFAFAIPALTLMTWAGWRTRRADPWVGWGLIALGTIAIAASLGMLLTPANS